MVYLSYLYLIIFILSYIAHRIRLTRDPSDDLSLLGQLSIYLFFVNTVLYLAVLLLLPGRMDKEVIMWLLFFGLI